MSVKIYVFSWQASLLALDASGAFDVTWLEITSSTARKVEVPKIRELTQFQVTIIFLPFACGFSGIYCQHMLEHGRKAVLTILAASPRVSQPDPTEKKERSDFS